MATEALPDPNPTQLQCQEVKAGISALSWAQSRHLSLLGVAALRMQGQPYLSTIPTSGGRKDRERLLVIAITADKDLGMSSTLF